MLKTFVVAALAAASLATPALATSNVTPVGVTASNTFPLFGDYKPENLINGSGLSGGLHDGYYGNMWMTDLGVDAAVLTFDLGGVYALSELRVWNYNFGREEFASTLDRAAKAFTLSVSFDGLSYTQILAGEFARGTGAPLAAETLDVSGRGRYVQLSLSGNHQQYPEIYGYSPIGLSEVGFGAVPEPGAWALMILGFGGAGAMLRRRRVTAAA